jgi:TonB family protein
MKKKTILTAVILLVLAMAVSAQTSKPDYAGIWTLDAGKSKFPATMQIESMTLKVTQTEKELTVTSTTMRARGDAAKAAQTIVYNLEGKESVVEKVSGTMAGTETRKASLTADGKLNLNFTRSYKSETADVNLKINEIWELMNENSILKITRYTETARGATNAEMYFTRNSFRGSVQTNDTDQNSQMNASAQTGDSQNVPKKISAGVLNGKAISLPKPSYPAEARAERVGGTVSVQLTIDEQGDVVSAIAISGHTLLRQASEQAARGARFAPTLLQGVPVKVTGVIVYNFVP